MLDFKNILVDWKSTILGLFISITTGMLTYLTANTTTPDLITLSGIVATITQAVLFALSNMFNPFGKK